MLKQISYTQALEMSKEFRDFHETVDFEYENIFSYIHNGCIHVKYEIAEDEDVKQTFWID